MLSCDRKCRQCPWMHLTKYSLPNVIFTLNFEMQKMEFLRGKRYYFQLLLPDEMAKE